MRQTPKESQVAKRTAVKQRTSDDINPRQPCPCGSGRRYKACHGAAGGDPIVTRPFAGLAAECELIALREFVPSATVTLPLRDDVDAKREITLGTVLPMAAAAIVRDESTALLGLQVQAHSADIGRDVAAAIGWALSANPGESLPIADSTGSTDVPRLAELIDPKAELDPLLHKNFAWWLPEGSEPSGEVGVALERANAAIMPTERLVADGVRAAYWVDAGEKAHLRWVRPEPEEDLLAALARLSVRGELTLGENSRYAGSFRAHGVLVPVWDLDPDMHAREWAEPAGRFASQLADALGSVADEPLTEAERRARDGLRGRQVTLR